MKLKLFHATKNKKRFASKQAIASLKNDHFWYSQDKHNFFLVELEADEEVKLQSFEDKEDLMKRLQHVKTNIILIGLEGVMGGYSKIEHDDFRGVYHCFGQTFSAKDGFVRGVFRAFKMDIETQGKPVDTITTAGYDFASYLEDKTTKMLSEGELDLIAVEEDYRKCPENYYITANGSDVSVEKTKKMIIVSCSTMLASKARMNRRILRYNFSDKTFTVLEKKIHSHLTEKESPASLKFANVEREEDKEEEDDTGKPTQGGFYYQIENDRSIIVVNLKVGQANTPLLPVPEPVHK